MYECSGEKMEKIMQFTGRGIIGGTGSGVALVSNQPLSFFGEVDPNTGNIISQKSEIKGENVSGRVLIFPHGRGSTVGSYVIFALKENGTAPCAIINEETEIIIAAGCSLANIPLIDRLNNFTTSIVRTGDTVKFDGNKGWVEIERNSNC
jgi:predicted aconitase with swiveling domain